MPEQTATVTRLVRARQLTNGAVIERDTWATGRAVRQQIVVLDVETHPSPAGDGESVTSGIGMDEAGEQVRLHWAAWAVVRLVVA